GGEVEEAAALEELRREARVGAEQEVALVVDDAGVEVGHRHRRSARGRLTVHLRVVAVDQFRVGGAEEETGYGEAAVAAPLCDAGLLEEVERPAAGSDEDELRVDLGRLVRAVVADGDLPAV